MKKFNLAALPLAVAGVLASTSALAGTEACFEVYKGGDALATAAFATPYNLAACKETRGGAAADDLAINDVVAIAYELTGKNSDGEKVFDIDFDDIDNTGAITGDDQYIVYIPTTDIPGGTKIDMMLSGSEAEFSGNGNQIHLVKYDEVAADGSFLAVASSDGTLDGTDSITFITKAGTTIGAGTRLIFSKVSTGAADADLVPVGIKLGNTQCTDATRSSSVMLEVTDAVTDGGTGYSIQGAVSKPQVIAEISPQFYALHGGTTAEALVNAESEDSANTAIIARTEFVYNAGDASDQLIVKQHEAVYKTSFYDRAAVLDQAISLDADDHLETKFVASSAPGDEVEMGLYNGRTAATGVLAGQEDVETGTTWGKFGLNEAAATTYNTEALDLFPAVVPVGSDAETNPALAASNLFGAVYNEMYYVVTNDRAPGAASEEIMNFNYSVDTHYTLDFGTDNELDHCAQEKKSHQIGVNGAVLKVPYVVSAAGNFVRITNEHDEAAEVTFDMFGESTDGTVENRKVTAISLGTVAAQSSVVYLVPEILSAAQAAGYLGQDGGYAAADFGSNAKSGDNRHTVTFTVTAPRDSVHGVSVQKIIGGLDRVMPVLDQNEWSQ
ncbi:hypothetical protein [Pseudocolwellia agarivorans]|uniref:hypothetical protein n=1 Tax=Pseudocolwellia agarivorans TaxID=1911682 RepID=UPI00098666E6|nr:hypothetical protein [Pseudocolwellia agarivorans]